MLKRLVIVSISVMSLSVIAGDAPTQNKQNAEDLRRKILANTSARDEAEQQARCKMMRVVYSATTLAAVSMVYGLPTSSDYPLSGEAMVGGLSLFCFAGMWYSLTRDLYPQSI